MGLLSRLSEWVASLTGRTEPEDTSAEATESDASDDASDAGDELESDSTPSGLDPSAAADTRTTANDDAVEALRDVRRSHAGQSDADGLGDADHADADHADADHGDTDHDDADHADTDHDDADHDDADHADADHADTDHDDADHADADHDDADRGAQSGRDRS